MKLFKNSNKQSLIYFKQSQNILNGLEIRIVQLKSRKGS